MYRPKERQTLPLFPELFPLGSGLRRDNRWIKLGRLIPWNQMEEVYREYFSDRMGRPAKDSRLICGLLAVKHSEGYSDERLVEEYLENPYVQAFCGEEAFVTNGGIDPSPLSKIRKRLGKQFFRHLEKDVVDVLKRRRIIGHAKINFGLDRIRYTVKDSEEMWIRLGLLAMNLSTALMKTARGGVRRDRTVGMAGAMA